jgi:hypothetical protein
MKKQATLNSAPTTSNRVGRVTATATVGTLFGLGRIAAKVGSAVGRAAVDFGAGVKDASLEIKRGYDDAKASK